MSDREDAADRPWYAEVTRYQWLVLVIASLGWVFDVFEGQIFVASMNDAMPELVPPPADASPEAIERHKGQVEYYKNVTLSWFLFGGAVGGVVFGVVSDRIGRRKTMVYTILMYSAFTCLSAFATNWWHMAAFRFLVAMGVGGEWAVASAMVAEVFPKRARARSLGIFHASSVLGTYLAVAVGALALNWRWGFVVGAVPALLTIWIRVSLKEPENWEQARAEANRTEGKQLGNLAELFRGRLLRPTLVGIGLGTVGLATFWGTHIFGKNLMRDAAAAEHPEQPPADAAPEIYAKQRSDSLKRWEMLGMFLVTTGGGLGLLTFGPLSERIGRRGAFLVFHLGALLAALAAFQVDWSLEQLYVVLPVFGFLTLGMHAGYAVYFPELFPTRVRGTGAGVCFNLARLAVFVVLFVTGWMQRSPADGGLGLTRNDSATYLSLLFLVGAVLLLFAPETRGRELPE
jgi:MFS family permease